MCHIMLQHLEIHSYLGKPFLFLLVLLGRGTVVWLPLSAVPDWPFQKLVRPPL